MRVTLYIYIYSYICVCVCMYYCYKDSQWWSNFLGVQPTDEVSYLETRKQYPIKKTIVLCEQYGIRIIKLQHFVKGIIIVHNNRLGKNKVYTMQNAYYLWGGCNEWYSGSVSSSRTFDVRRRHGRFPGTDIRHDPITISSPVGDWI